MWVRSFFGDGQRRAGWPAPPQQLHSISIETAPSVASIAVILIFFARGGAGAELAYYPNLASPPHEFDTIERCFLTGPAKAPPVLRQAAESFSICWDSGCTAYAFPASDRWMLDQIDAVDPNIGLEVASGTVLKVETIGRINSTGEPRLVCDSFIIALIALP